MSERTIPIEPYVKADNLIVLKSELKISDVEELIPIPDNNYIKLFDYTLSDGSILVPREHDHLEIAITPVYKDGISIDDFRDLLIKGESPLDVLDLVIQVTCNSTRWGSNQIRVSLNDVNGKHRVKLKIPVSEIHGLTDVKGWIIRKLDNKEIETRKANLAYSVLSDCEPIQIQVDEIRDIGGNHLPLFMKNYLTGI